MKNIIRVIVLVVVLLLCCVDCHAQAPQNYRLVKKVCVKNYGHNNIRIVKGYSKKVTKIITHRKNKPYIVVEKIVSRSHGRYGYDKHGYYIRYNKKVKKGKKVISYCIYNPYTNYCDDVDFVVDNQKVRWYNE